MKLVGRIIMGVVLGAIAYFSYIFLPQYLLEFLDSSVGTGTGLVVGVVEIDLGDFSQLVFYLKSVGFILVGLNFAFGLAPDKTALKAVWRFLKIFLSIAFWGIFLFVDFNNIDVSVSDIFPGTDLFLAIDITGLFWVMMGASIFDLIVAVLDIFIGLMKEKPKAPKTPKTPPSEPEPVSINTSTTYMTGKTENGGGTIGSN